MQGWNLALKDDQSKVVTPEELEGRLAERGISGLAFLDASSWTRVSTLSKPVRAAIEAERHILTVNSPRFMHGQGLNK